jgi:hypothetical protein
MIDSCRLISKHPPEITGAILSHDGEGPGCGSQSMVMTDGDDSEPINSELKTSESITSELITNGPEGPGGLDKESNNKRKVRAQ